MAKKKRPLFKGLEAIVSALAEKALTKAQVDEVLRDVRYGIGFSKRDKALGMAIEGATNLSKDTPQYWEGLRDGLVTGYEQAREDVAKGGTLRPIADLISEVQAEAEKAN